MHVQHKIIRNKVTNKPGNEKLIKTRYTFTKEEIRHLYNAMLNMERKEFVEVEIFTYLGIKVDQ